MIEIYNWLFKAQDEIIIKIERMTGIRVPISFIKIGNLDGSWGQFIPEAGHYQADTIDTIILNQKLFKMGHEYVLIVLSHEILHSAEKIVNQLENAHSPQFRMWEMELIEWTGTYSDSIPQIDFENYHLWKIKSGVSKIICYECACGIQINHLEELNIHCDDCHKKFYIVDDGRVDFQEELTQRTKLLLSTVNQLRRATDEQIWRYRILGLDKKIGQLCMPIKSEVVKSVFFDNQSVKRMMEILQRRVLNVCAMNEAKVNSLELSRILSIIEG